MPTPYTYRAHTFTKLNNGKNTIGSPGETLLPLQARVSLEDVGLQWTQSDGSLEHSSQCLKESGLSLTLTCLPAVSTISRLAGSVRKAYETNVRDKRAGYVGTSWKCRGGSESGIGGRANHQFLNK